MRTISASAEIVLGLSIFLETLYNQLYVPDRSPCRKVLQKLKLNIEPGYSVVSLNTTELLAIILVQLSPTWSFNEIYITLVFFRINARNRECYWKEDRAHRDLKRGELTNVRYFWVFFGEGNLVDTYREENYRARYGTTCVPSQTPCFQTQLLSRN